MGIYGYAKKSMKSDKRFTIYYLIAMVITTLIIYIGLNVSQNPLITTSIGTFTEYFNPSPIIMGNIDTGILYTRDASLILQENVLYVVIFSIFFSFVCSTFYLKRKSKEIGFLVVNGSSLLDVARFMIVQNFIILTISGAIAIILGIITTPLFNLVINNITNSQGDLFYFSIDTVYMTLGFLLIQFTIIIMSNYSYCVLREAKDLLIAKDEIRKKDDRMIKIGNWPYLIMYLMPFIMLPYAKEMKGAENLIIPLANIGFIGSFVMIKRIVPNFINMLKRKRLMYNDKTVVYASDFVKNLTSSLSYLICMEFTLGYLLGVIIKSESIDTSTFTGIMNKVNYVRLEGITQNITFCCFSISILVGMTFLYKLVTGLESNGAHYRQMHIMGYSKEEIVKIVKNESLVFIFGALIIPLLHLLSILYVFYIKDRISMLQIGWILGGIFIPMILAVIVARILNGRNVLTMLESDVYNFE